MEMQHEHLDAETAQKMYDEYKQDHIKKQAEYFFSNHSNEHWF
jgi:hypothetical protein